VTQENTSKTCQVKQAKVRTHLDGKFDGPYWKENNTLLLDGYIFDKPTHFPRTEVKSAYNEYALNIIFQVKDQYILATQEYYQKPVCQDSCVEFFFVPSTDYSVGYFNLEMNCGGVFLFRHQHGLNVNPTMIAPGHYDKIDVYHSEPKIVNPEKKQPTT